MIQSLGQLIARVLIDLLFIVAGIFETHAQSFYCPYISSVAAGRLMSRFGLHT